VARPPKVTISLRLPKLQRTELDALAKAASEATGRRVTRSDVHRQILADGIRRARQAPQYVARLAGDQPPPRTRTRAPDPEGAR